MGHTASKFGAHLNPQTFTLSKPFNQLPLDLSLVTGTPWNIRNAALHNDLKIQTVNELVKSHYRSLHSKTKLPYKPFN